MCMHYVHVYTQLNILFGGWFSGCAGGSAAVDSDDGDNKLVFVCRAKFS